MSHRQEDDQQAGTSASSDPRPPTPAAAPDSSSVVTSSLPHPSAALTQLTVAQDSLDATLADLEAQRQRLNLPSLLANPGTDDPPPSSAAAQEAGPTLTAVFHQQMRALADAARVGSNANPPPPVNSSGTQTGSLASAMRATHPLRNPPLPSSRSRTSSSGMTSSLRYPPPSTPTYMDHLALELGDLDGPPPPGSASHSHPLASDPEGSSSILQGAWQTSGRPTEPLDDWERISAVDSDPSIHSDEDDQDEESMEIDWSSNPLQTLLTRTASRLGAAARARGEGESDLPGGGHILPGLNSEDGVGRFISAPAVGRSQLNTHSVGLDRLWGLPATGIDDLDRRMFEESAAAARSNRDRGAGERIREWQDEREMTLHNDYYVDGVKSGLRGEAARPLYLGHLPYAETFDFASLPTHFSQTDHSALLSISTSGFLASYIPKSSRSDRDAASVRANCPIPTSVGLFYFEVEIVDAGQRGYIGIGLSGKRVNLSRLPGWEKGSFGWHGDDGMVFCEKGQGSPFGPSYTTGDVIGCGLDVAQKSVFYTKNGIMLGHVFQGLNVEELYPTVGLRTPREEVRINFGVSPFKFDIQAHFKLRQRSALDSVLSTARPLVPSSSFLPPLQLLTAPEQEELARCEKELRLKRAALEDGRGDSASVSALQRSVWDLLDRSAKPAPAGVDKDGLEGSIGIEKDAGGREGKRKWDAPVKSTNKGKKASKKGVEGEKTSAAIKELVSQYLAHQRFSSTVAALARNSTPVDLSSTLSPLKPSHGTAVEEPSVDHRIRAEIEAGKMDDAFGSLERSYPAVLASKVGFQLKCIKLAMIILAAAPSSTATDDVPSSRTTTMTTEERQVDRLLVSSKKRKAPVDVKPHSTKAFRSSSHPDKSPSTSPSLNSSTLSFGASTSATSVSEAVDPMDEILTYARSLAAEAESYRRSSSNPDGDDRQKELVEGCLALLAYEDVKTMSSEDMSAAAFVMRSMAAPEGLKMAAGLVENRILALKGFDQKPALETVLAHTVAVQRQMHHAHLGEAAFVDVEDHLQLRPLSKVPRAFEVTGSAW